MTFAAVLATLTDPEDVYVLHERAGIYEYLGGMTRADAEAAAVVWWRSR